MMGRPKKDIDWSDVEKLCSIQCTQEEIAAFCEVSADTLTRRCQEVHGVTFAEYFGQKRGMGRISLRRAQWLLATDKKNPAMLIFLGKQYLGQTDTVEIGSSDKRPVVLKYRLDDEEKGK